VRVADLPAVVDPALDHLVDVVEDVPLLVAVGGAGGRRHGRARGRGLVGPRERALLPWAGQPGDLEAAPGLGPLVVEPQLRGLQLAAAVVGGQCEAIEGAGVLAEDGLGRHRGRVTGGARPDGQLGLEDLVLMRHDLVDPAVGDRRQGDVLRVAVR
jgi:hypothetical protein